MQWYKLNGQKWYNSLNKAIHIIERTKMENPFRMQPFLQEEMYHNQST